MRRETFILMSVFVLLGAGFLFLQLKNKPLVDPDRTFHIEDKRRVHEVFITHRDGEQVKLSRKGTSWLLNDRFPVNPNVMENVLVAIAHRQLNYVRAQAAG
ncbi:MAG: hypothetical protein ACK56V_18255, partial [Bacteroidota bacterium]